MNKILIAVVVVILVGVGFYFFIPKKAGYVDYPTPITSTTTQIVPNQTSEIFYKNSEYGFLFNLPNSWEGYTIIEDEWSGDRMGAGQMIIGSDHGPIISIRHPDWEYKAPLQDIPIMVFTIEQWNDMQGTDGFHVGPAPMNPSEIGQNSRYVFAIPARYNFSYLTGYEEVEQVIQGNNFKAF